MNEKVEVKMNEETVQYYITSLENLCSNLQQENEQLKEQLESNWNELKKWLEVEKYCSYGCDISDCVYEEIIRSILDKMQELEAKDEDRN